MATISPLHDTPLHTIAVTQTRCCISTRRRRHCAMTRCCVMTRRRGTHAAASRHTRTAASRHFAASHHTAAPHAETYSPLRARHGSSPLRVHTHDTDADSLATANELMAASSRPTTLLLLDTPPRNNTGTPLHHDTSLRHCPPLCHDAITRDGTLLRPDTPLCHDTSPLHDTVQPHTH